MGARASESSACRDPGRTRRWSIFLTQITALDLERQGLEELRGHSTPLDKASVPLRFPIPNKNAGDGSSTKLSACSASPTEKRHPCR